jgi:putative inorganic carbon (HCO3(-)) transporter
MVRDLLFCNCVGSRLAMTSPDHSSATAELDATVDSNVPWSAVPAQVPDGVALANRNSSLSLSIAYGAVWVFTAFYFVRPQDYFPDLVVAHMPKLTGALAGIALLGALLGGVVRLGREAKFMLALVAWVWIAVPFSTWHGGSFAIATDFLKMVIIATAAFVSVISFTRLRRLVNVQILGMIVLSALAIREPAKIGRMYGVGSMFSDPNDFALNLCIVMPICCASFLAARRWVTKLFWLGTMTLVTAAIVATQSRGGFLALVAVIFTFVRNMRLAKRTMLSLVLVSLLLGAVLFAFGGPAYTTRVATIINPDADATGSAQGRRELLFRSLKLTAAHPMFGVGPGQFAEFSGNWHGTHNTYTQISSETGLVGFVLFVGMLWMSFKNLNAVLRRVRQKSQPWYLAMGLLCGMVGYCVGAFFLTTGFLLYPYLLVAYSAALAKIASADQWAEPAARVRLQDPWTTVVEDKGSAAE